MAAPSARRAQTCSAGSTAPRERCAPRLGVGAAALRCCGLYFYFYFYYLTHAISLTALRAFRSRPRSLFFVVKKASFSSFILIASGVGELLRPLCDCALATGSRGRPGARTQCAPALEEGGKGI